MIKINKKPLTIEVQDSAGNHYNFMLEQLSFLDIKSFQKGDEEELIKLLSQKVKELFGAVEASDITPEERQKLLEIIPYEIWLQLIASISQQINSIVQKLADTEKNLKPLSNSRSDMDMTPADGHPN